MHRPLVFLTIRRRPERDGPTAWGWADRHPSHSVACGTAAQCRWVHPLASVDRAGARWVPLHIGGNLDSERAGAVLGRYNHACIAVPHAAWETELGRDAGTDVSVVNVGGNDARHDPMAHGVDIRFSLV